MKRKNILVLGLATLLMVGCNNHGNPISKEQAVAQAATMRQKVESSEFEIPKKVTIVDEAETTLLGKTAKVRIEVSQDLENYGFSIKTITETEGKKDEQYVAIYLDGTVLYVVDSEDKDYAKADLGEQAVNSFTQSVATQKYYYDKEYVSLALSSIAQAVDEEALEAAIKSQVGAMLGSNLECKVAVNAASKGESHLYVATDASLTFGLEQSGTSVSGSLSSKASIEFENYLFVSSYSETYSKASTSYNGQNITEESKIISRVSVSYGASFVKPDLTGYSESQIVE